MSKWLSQFRSYRQSKFFTGPAAILSAILLLVPNIACGDIVEIGPGKTYTTILDGYNAANNGATLLIYDDVYTLNDTLYVTKEVTFQAVNIGGARITGGGSGIDDSMFFISANSSFIGLLMSDSNSSHAIYQRDSGGHAYIQQSIFTGISDPVAINNSVGTSGSYEVVNSTFVDALAGVGINDGGTIDVTNSIFANVNTPYLIHNGLGINPSHNLLFNVNQVSSGGPVSLDPNQIIADPLFVNPGVLDYRLLPGSPAIDSGKDVGLPYFGSAPDRGAFETVPEPSGGFLVLAGLPIALVARFRRRRNHRDLVEELKTL